MTQSLGDRMKANYEDRFRIQLTRRLPVIVRLDGRSFHTITRHCEKPYDKHLSSCMADTALFLCQRVLQGAKIAYTQSDEISALLVDYDLITTQAWFDYNLQKIVSISAAEASVKFTELFGRPVVFDSRAFNIPIDEVCNYFIWRQKNWQCNSVEMLAQANFSPKQLLNKKQVDMHDMLKEKGVHWVDLEPRWKNGLTIAKDNDGEWEIIDAPIFTERRETIEALLQRKD